MIPNIGIPSLILILIIAILIFGPSKLPEMGKAIGTTFKEFKNSMNDMVSDKDSSDKNSNGHDK